ncbi:hypothetical protein BH11MYX2_BH11MYX2_25750 [soil metagenome]
MTCWKPFDAPASDRTVTCPPCAETLANAPVPSLRPSSNWRGMAKILGLVVGGALLVLVGLYIHGHSGLAGEVSDFADEMCECHDATCAQSVASRYDDWVRSHSDKLVTRFEEVDIQANVDRLRGCVRASSPSPFASLTEH